MPAAHALARQDRRGPARGHPARQARDLPQPRVRPPAGAGVRDVRPEHLLRDRGRARGHPRVRRQARAVVPGPVTGGDHGRARRQGGDHHRGVEGHRPRARPCASAREGASVICAARSADLVKETTAEVNKAGGRAIAVHRRRVAEDDVQRLVAAGLQAFGKIDTLVNNAGDGGPTKPVQDYTMEDWRYTIDSCLTSSYLCIALRRAGDDQGRRRRHREHLLRGRAARAALPHRLLLGQGRPGRA